MAGANKQEETKTYNIDAAKAAASTGWTGDMSKYGIDYSQEQRDAIANIFRDSATAAYKTGMNEFSNTMAQQQSTLQDTIRRSQAQAVATGASRGMQAANELSSMLGLQQAAAQEASKTQGTYAEALANASQKAYDVQNAANQIGAQMYAADSASEAQKYAANMDAYMNDPYRIISEAAVLRESGRASEADALLQSFLAGSGVSEGAIANNISNATKEYNAQAAEREIAASGLATDSSEANDIRNKYAMKTQVAPVTSGLNMEHGKGNNFSLTFNGTKYKHLEVGTAAPAEVTAKANAAGVQTGQFFVYAGEVYMKQGDKTVRVGGTGTGGGGVLDQVDTQGTYSDYNNFKAALVSSGYELK